MRHGFNHLLDHYEDIILKAKAEPLSALCECYNVTADQASRIDGTLCVGCAYSNGKRQKDGTTRRYCNKLDTNIPFPFPPAKDADHPSCTFRDSGGLDGTPCIDCKYLRRRQYNLTDWCEKLNIQIQKSTEE
jgi:hypothetical protein